MDQEFLSSELPKLTEAKLIRLKCIICTSVNSRTVHTKSMTFLGKVMFTLTKKMSQLSEPYKNFKDYAVTIQFF